MGNRAIVVFKNRNELSPQIYLHWNGGPESVMGFLNELERRKYTRLDYAPARFVQVAGEFFRGVGESLERDDAFSLRLFQPPKDLSKATLESISHGDNGVYIVDRDNNGFTVSSTCFGKFDNKTIDKVLRKDAKKYREGFEDSGFKKMKSIEEFFLQQEALLRANQTGGE
jgi:hypothetical protein